jgi:hypothetical protein
MGIISAIFDGPVITISSGKLSNLYKSIGRVRHIVLDRDFQDLAKELRFLYNLLSRDLNILI